MLTDALHDYAARRDEVLRRTTAALEADPAVVAAWLSGSYGRGEDDAWSDLDLHVAIEDGRYAAVIEAPDRLFGVAGEVLLMQGGIPSNSMPEGMFWLVMYPGPVEIDWNVGPASHAVRPTASRPLFDRGPVPPSPEGTPPGDLRDRANSDVRMFWAMAPIALKYAGRGHTQLAVRQCALLHRALTSLWLAVHQPAQLGDRYQQNRPLDAALDAVLPRFVADIAATDAIDVVRGYCEIVAGLHPALEALGVPVPARMPGEVERLAEVAAGEAARGGSAPGRGSRR